MAKNQKGLGRGIEALFNTTFKDFDCVEKEVEQFDRDKESIIEISVDDIRPNPYQPRKQFDDKSLKELAESIAVNGVFQPIIVRKSKIKGYELVAGERRLRASKLAKKITIPCIIRDYSEEIMIQIAVIENLQRENLRPIDEALAYRMMMDTLSLNQEQVATRLGKSRPYIANYLRLLSLPKEVQDLLQEGQLTVGHARTLLGLKNIDYIREIAHKCITESMTVRQLEEVVQNINEPNVTSKKTNKKQVIKPPYIVESEDRLMDKFGTPVQITPKGDKGKIEIEYLSQNDLTRILDVLEIKFDDDL
ncbi:chromosome partitioning protein, ParB family [Granulicatella balaenopterae]|uniref:Chromosome partitioning protein, ParB family n=1 Tax=Granulicatella balaenopterae TaxID=137733 RepID=A0A1H9MC47_9LACT|nr:ParB/RepB/Spo0J family partition protein [Granulicatella balaenopterae]SER20713.1 chromosome partitioning protein, ParB family [Granulicatella balaenopterae]